MATYKEIFGKQIKALASDPTDTGAEGQIWYNTTLNNFKTVLNSAAWASVAPVTQSRDAAASAGTQNAAMIFGGGNEVSGGPAGGPNAYYNLTEEYNGSGFSQGGALNQGRKVRGQGTGTLTAGLGAGGYFPPAPGWTGVTEEYNGAAWTTVTAMPLANYQGGCAGTQIAAVITGGNTSASHPDVVTTTYEYDGTNWTAGGVLGTGRTIQAGMTGLQAAAVVFGGNLYPSARTDKVEEYNGTSWSEVTALPIATRGNMASGPQTSALTFGGNTPTATPGTTTAFTYDGTNFTATAAMGAAIQEGGSAKAAADNSTGLQMSGYGASTYTAVSQEYDRSINAITTSAWASAPSLNTARDSLSGGSGAGTQTAALCFTGRVSAGTGTANSEEYNGTSWAEGLNYPAIMNWVMGVGTQTAALGFNGQQLPPSSNTNTSSLYNGTTWTSAPTTNDTGRVRTGFGTSGAAIAACGNPPGPVGNTSESFDGSSWTNEPNTNASAEGRGSAAGSPQGAGLIFGGSAPSDGYQAETWDGSSWTEVGNLVWEKRYFSGFGISTACTGVAGGLGGSNPTVTTQSYDGTNWSTSPNIATSRMSIGNAAGAPSTAGMIYGGAPGFLTSAEVYEEETTALNYKTITTS